MTRGEFLGFGAVLAGAFTLGRRPGGVGVEQPVLAQPAAGGEPDLVRRQRAGPHQDAAVPRAEAFAVKDGRFLAVGATPTSGTSRPAARRSSTPRA